MGEHLVLLLVPVPLLLAWFGLGLAWFGLVWSLCWFMVFIVFPMISVVLALVWAWFGLVWVLVSVVFSNSFAWFGFGLACFCSFAVLLFSFCFPMISLGLALVWLGWGALRFIVSIVFPIVWLGLASVSLACGVGLRMHMGVRRNSWQPDQAARSFLLTV